MMVGGLAAFSRELQVLPETLMSEDDFRRLHAQTAREENAKIEAAENPSETNVFVDGRYGGDEDSVKFGGVILYMYSNLKEITEFTIDLLKKKAAEFGDSGQYASSFFLMKANNVRVDAFPDGTTTIIISNDVDYARKFEVRHYGFTGPSGIWELVYQDVRRKYANTAYIDLRFINLPNPYILRGGPVGVYKKAYPSRGIQAGDRRAGKDHKKGQPITYPAIIIKTGRGIHRR